VSDLRFGSFFSGLEQYDPRGLVPRVKETASYCIAFSRRGLSADDADFTDGKAEEEKTRACRPVFGLVLDFHLRNLRHLRINFYFYFYF